MSMPQPAVPPPKPTVPPFWNWLIRITTVFALALFLVPAVYVVKYYAVDKPHEMEQTKANNPHWPIELAPLQAEYLPMMEKRTQTGSDEERIAAIRRIGETLRQPYISVKRPLECLSAKATLADLATHAPDPSVRTAASDELGKVAQGGAVIRR